MLDDFLKQIYDEMKALRQDVQQLREELTLMPAETISYNLHDAAQLTGLSYETLFKRCKAGKLNYAQDGPGGSILILRKDLVDYMKKNSLFPETDEERQRRILGKDTAVITGKLRVSKR